MNRYIVALWLVFQISVTSSAQEVKTLGLGGDLWSVNPRNGQASFVGLTGFHTHFWNSFAMDSQGRLFGAYGRYFAPYAIYEIDPHTGAASFVVQTNFIGIRAMAFDDQDVLFVGNERDAPLSLSPTDIHTLDLGTGASTLIGEAGVFKLHTLDFHDGELYGYALDHGLCRIDLATGAAIDVAPELEGPWNFATVSMAFDNQGALYYLDTYLWMFDAETAGTSLVDEVSVFGYWADAVFIEGPTPTFTLWLAGQTDGPMGVKFSGATPGGEVAIAWTSGPGGPTAIANGFPCAGVELDLNSDMRLLGIVAADQAGKATLGPQFVPASARGQIRVQAVDLATCETSNRVIVAY